MSQPTAEDYQHIREKIVDYLARQSFSERKLLQKVTDLKKNYPKTKRYEFYTPVHVQKVLDEFKEQGLINDWQYARDVLRSLKDRKDGIHRIQQKMYRRLIPKEIIEAVLREWREEGKDQDYAVIIRETKRKAERLAEKYPGKREQYTNRQRLYAFLAQKGYEPEEIGEIIQRAS